MLPRLTAVATALMLGASAAPALAADHVTFVLDWFPSGEVAFPYIGVQEGFFKAAGLDVTIEIGRGGADAVTRVATGADDFGGAALNPLMAATVESPVPEKAVLSVYSKQPDAIITSTTSGISSIKDLAGKTVATATFSSSNPLWPIIAKANGLDPDSVKLLKVDSNALAPMLAAGRVDAVISWITSGPADGTLLKEAGKQIKILPWSQYGLNGYGWSILASDTIIKTKPDVVRRFVQAYQKCIDFYLTQPKKSAEDLHAMVPDASVDTAEDEVRAAYPLIKNDITAKYGMGTFDKDLLQQTWVWVAKAQGFAVDKVDPESLVDRSFVAH